MVWRMQNSGESGNDVLSVKGLTMGFGTNILFRDLSFLIQKHDRVFFAGPNGCGKSTLIKLLLGQLEPLAGEIEFGYNVTIGYYDQENQNLSDDNTVLDELWNAYPHLTQTEIRNTLALFRFVGEDIEKEVRILSGGERARLTLAKLILSKMNVLILDEPTNHLDIGSREALEDALTQFEGTILAVSHDRYFTRKLATRFIDLAAGPGQSRDFHGTYDEYIAQGGKPGEESDAARAEKADEALTQKEEYLRRKQETAKLRQAERRAETIKKEIARLETEICDIDDALFGEAATDYHKAAELSDRKTTAEDRLMQLYEEEESLTRFLAANAGGEE